ncbi:tyrosine-type recombinase/integrase [Mycobacterium marinum]|uniref:tyrosine-type recombinase/integrase n=1 Tax=Mycobacterium marinum TaxID=1781 RepID=UPI001FB69463|nr:site-specific integrase [Mycobacterium marinum]
MYYATHTFSTKMDAEVWLADERKLLDRKEWTPPADRAQIRRNAGITVREYSALWMRQRDLTAKTRELYIRLLNSRILPSLGEESLQAVTPARVREWWVGLGKETETSNAQAYQLLKAMYNTAVGDRAASDNPCQIVSAGRPPKPRAVKPLTSAELVKVAESVPEEYRAAVPVAAWCGLRFGELIELRRKDIHVTGARMELKIRRAATLVENKIVIGKPKTDAGVRSVAVPPHVADILREHLRKHTRNGPEAFVFTTTRGQRLSKTAFTRSVKKGFAAVGKPEMRVHDLRHVGATLAAQVGATTKELMARLGHSTPGMAMRYQIAAQDRDAAIADKLSKLANGG